MFIHEVFVNGFYTPRQSQAVLLEYQGKGRFPRLLVHERIQDQTQVILIAGNPSGDVITFETRWGRFQLVENADVFWLLCNDEPVTTLPVDRAWQQELIAPEGEKADQPADQ